jgi:catechol 2,3-dioxygenase-like lactoylglutathione lyase family enzyme
MISGAHVVLYSTDAEADRAFFRDVLEYPFVDAGHSWLIFALPPAELAVHPADSGGHELFLMCDDVAAFVAQMAERNVECAAVSTERWGLLTRVTLPGGGTLGVYQPSHPSPLVKG